MPTRARVGEIRPSQMLYAFGIGSVVDLPNLSAVVMGLDDWDISYCREITEERLLVAVREELGAQVQRLLSPPKAPETATILLQPFDESSRVGQRRQRRSHPQQRPRRHPQQRRHLDTERGTTHRPI
jgi:hypothetical protein